MSGIDINVSKELLPGLLSRQDGLAKLVAFSPERDTTLVKLDSEYLFEKNTTFISVRRNRLCLPVY
jgi:LysR family cys regulon transcriptional activator